MTVVEINSPKISFDVIPETLQKTTLGQKTIGSLVNLERALKMGDELGGHLLSGHIIGLGKITDKVQGTANLDFRIECPQNIMKFVQEKGYIAIDGISLTIGEVDEVGFSLHLIPETLRLTTLGEKQTGEGVNLEIDSTTMMIVETVERMMKES